MELFLIHKKMWNVVVDSSATAEQSQGALALIGLHVKDHHLRKVAAAKTAKELWDILEATYKRKSYARKMLLRREIKTLKLGSDEPISMYVARAEDLHKNLTAAGSNMKPEELAFAILAGLPDEYGTLVTILEATSEKMSAKEMLPLLLQTEARLKLQGSSEKGESQATAYAAKGLSSKKGFAYKKGSSGSSGGGSRSSVSRYRCGGAHKLTECKVSKEIECRSCGKTGHMHDVCWKKHGKPTGAKFGGKGKLGSGEKGVAFTAHEEIGARAWILDLGQHLTGDKGKFKILEAAGSRKEIEFGNKQTLAAEGVGEVELRCVTPDGEQVVTLKKVYYILGVVVNLFSVRRATEKGAEVYLSKERCYVKYEGEVVMQVKGVKGLWFVKEAEKTPRSSRRRRRRRSCGIGALGMRDLRTLQSWPRGSWRTELKSGRGSFRRKSRRSVWQSRQDNTCPMERVRRPGCWS
jgi:hypothetical protein